MRTLRTSIRQLFVPLSIAPLIALSACGSDLNSSEAAASHDVDMHARAAIDSYGNDAIVDGAQVNASADEPVLVARAAASNATVNVQVAELSYADFASDIGHVAYAAPVAVQAAAAPIAQPLTATQRAAAQCGAETPVVVTPTPTPTPTPAPVVPKSPEPPVVVAPSVVPTVKGGYASDSSEVTRLYGPGAFVMDGLWNMNAQRTGNTETFVSIRFRAPVSGSMSHVRLYWSDGSGYAGGNGGDITLKVLPDDDSAAHNPVWSATPLATGRRVPGSLSMSNATYRTAAHRFSPDTLSGTGQLVAGKLYHLVAINTASNPSANWSSLNMGWTAKAHGLPNRWQSATDYASLAGSRPAGSSAAPTWIDRTTNAVSGGHFAPIMQMTMANGQQFGNTNMETGNYDAGGRLWKNGSANPVRERFTPKQARTISGLSIQTAKVSGSGNLGWQIVQGSTVLASGTIAQSSANYRVDSSVGSTGVMTWYDVSLPSAVTLRANTAYDVVFTPQSSSVWAFADQRNGASYGFSSPAAFTESQAQHYLSGKWLDANHWAKTSSSGGSNWRVVLHQKG